MEDRYIQVGNIKARYWDTPGSGTPVLLLHGIGASVEVWSTTFPALDGHRRVLAVDLPGFGRSDKPDARQAFLRTLRAQANVLGQRKTVFGPILAGLSRVTAPTLVLWGQQDRIIPVAHAEVARAIAGARVEVWDGCGHLPMIERSEQFNRLLLEFVGA